MRNKARKDRREAEAGGRPDGSGDVGYGGGEGDRGCRDALRDGEMFFRLTEA